MGKYQVDDAQLQNCNEKQWILPSYSNLISKIGNVLFDEEKWKCWQALHSQSILNVISYQVVFFIIHVETEQNVIIDDKWKTDPWYILDSGER